MAVYTPPNNPGGPPAPITNIQQDTTQFARDVAAVAQALSAIYAQALALQGRQSIHDYVGRFNSTATYAINPDGSIGPTDPAPVATNPMVGLNVTASDLSGFIGYGLNDFIEFWTGSGETAVADRRPAAVKLLQ